MWMAFPAPHGQPASLLGPTKGGTGFKIGQSISHSSSAYKGKITIVPNAENLYDS